MHSRVSTAFHGADNTVTYTAFRQGSSVFVFDLTAYLSNDERTEPTYRSSLQAEVHFGVALKHPIICFFYSEYDNCIEIDAERKISVSYLIFF